MLAIKSLDDLPSPDDLARSIVEDLANRLLVTDHSTIRPYDPDADGWVVLISETDVDQPLTEIWGDDAYRLIDVPWEGVTRQDRFYVAVFLANNDFGLVFVIPDEDWLPDELRNVLEDNLVPSPDKSTNQP